jgi:4-aminobutyrate aminotransferase-like enzyme
MDAWPPSTGEALHTSTFLGNPLGCAMALASLEIHARPETAEKVRAAGARLHSLLLDLDSPNVTAVKGLGLMLGLDLRDGTGKPSQAIGSDLMCRALRDGLIVLSESPQGNVLSLVPPFDVSREEMTWTRDRLQEYLMSLPGSVS